VFLEVTSGTDAALAGLRPALTSTLAVLGEYMAEQMARGRLRPMHPLLAIQSVIGPIFFHLLSRPSLERLMPIPMTPLDAVDDLVLTAVSGLEP
jgi:hypothetical protein